MRLNKYTIACIFFSSCLFAQQSKTDSLSARLKQTIHDTDKVNTLIALAWELKSNNPDISIILSEQALIISEKIKFKTGIGKSNHNLGELNYLKANYPNALDYYFRALSLWEKLEKEVSSNNRQSIINNKSKTLGNIGNVYVSQTDYHKALDYYFKALKIKQKLRNKKEISITLGNIGVVYRMQSDYPKALDYYFRALKIKEELGDKKSIAMTINNIAIIYHTQSDYTKALAYYFKALNIVEELEDKRLILRFIGNIGIVYKEQSETCTNPNEKSNLLNKALDYYLNGLKMAEELGDKEGIEKHFGNIGNIYYQQSGLSFEFPTKKNLLNKALDYYFKALKMAEELGDKEEITNTLGSIGSLYTKTGKYKEAEKHFLKGLEISKEIGVRNNEMQFEESLSDLYTKINSHKKALEHFKKAMALKDTIFSQENKKELVRKEMNYEFEKKETLQKTEQEKKDAIAQEELKQKEQQRNYFFVGFALVVLLAGFIFRSLRITRKQKHIIEIQKDEVSRQKEIVEKQKHLVEEHQKEIIDSITYAKRLQQAILPPTELIKRYLPESFVLYKPKDIVAGDFYWMEIIDDIVFIAAADCTGHGVPGAMISVVCSNALNRTVKEFNLRDTGKILDKVTDLVLETFEKSGEQIKDGMDISFLSYNKTTKQIQWSGANNPLWYIQNGSINEITADKQPIGKYDNRKPFTTNNIKHSDNSVFYLFTDGLPDQFGGPKGKKFRYKRFENNLSDIRKLPMEEQQTILEKAFQDWKGNLEQVDDVTVIGIKI